MEEKEDLFVKGIISLIEEAGKKPELPNEIENTEEFEQKYLELNNKAIAKLATKDLSKTVKSEIAIKAMREMLDKITLFVRGVSQGDTFALPTLPVMFALLPVFTGKPVRSPKGLKKILEKPENQRTEEEQELVKENMDMRLMVSENDEVTSKGTLKKKAYTVFICDSPIIQATAKLDSNMNVEEETLAAYVSRVFGPEGMRHMMALLAGLEENGRQGKFTLTINEHLERMGYKREKSGSFNSRIKLVASDIIKILGGLSLNSIRPGNKNIRITSQRLFTLVKSDVKLDLNKDIIEGYFEIRAEDWWYKDAFREIANEPPKYCKLLKETIFEDHVQHSITISLIPILGTFWSQNPEIDFTVTRLMEWCNLDHSTPKFGGDKHRLDRLRELERELDYMKSKDYLGNWWNNQPQRPSECENPFDCVLTLTAPYWFEEKIIEIEEKQDELPEPSKDRLLTQAEFIDILDKSGLKIDEFAEKIGVSKRTVQYIRSGEKAISKKLAMKIREIFKK